MKQICNISKICCSSQRSKCTSRSYSYIIKDSMIPRRQWFQKNKSSMCTSMISFRQSKCFMGICWCSKIKCFYVYFTNIGQNLGLAIIFGSLEIATLQYAVYPPFGLITTAFMPLGSYLLFIGIFSSAQNISRNIVIRKELYKSANSQLDLLKIIGMAQM